MKIVYLGQFRYSYSTEIYVEYALRSKGVTVVRQPYDAGMNPKQRWEHIQKHNPDFVLFSKAPVPGTEAILDLCRAHEIPTVCWQWDIYFGARECELPPQFYADYLLTTDGGHSEEFSMAGCNHSVLRQGIHKPHASMKKPNYLYDVGFVGGLGKDSIRQGLIKWLSSTYRKRFVHHTKTRGTKLNEALAQIRIVVGDSYPSDHYWSNRIYEITGRGGFILHPYTVGLSDDFQDGVHYLSYERNNFKELKKKIEQCLEDTETTDRIRVDGHDHCKNNLTYDHRVAELLQRVTSPKKELV